MSTLRSYEKLTPDDIDSLVEIERRERERLMRTSAVWAAHRDRLLCVAIAQAAAQHLLDGVNGIKDLDVWTFFARREDLPQRVVDSGFRGWRKRDFGESHLGRRTDPEFDRLFPTFRGRNVDLFGVAIPAQPADDPAEAVRQWLAVGRTSRARYLGEKAVVMLEPRRLEVVWPLESVGKPLKGYSAGIPAATAAGGATAVEKLEALGVRGILLQLARDGQIVDVRCEMPQCYCFPGRRYFDPRSPRSDWSPTPDHYPRLRARGGQLTPDNVRLAHLLCNRRDYGWRMKINAMLEKRMSLEEIAARLNAQKVPPIHGANRWTATSVRKAFVS